MVNWSFLPATPAAYFYSHTLPLGRPQPKAKGADRGLPLNWQAEAPGGSACPTKIKPEALELEPYSQTGVERTSVSVAGLAQSDPTRF
jgi:hypothetical protein